MPKIAGRKVKVQDISAPREPEKLKPSEPKKSHKLLYSCLSIIVIVVLAIGALGFWMNAVAKQNLADAEQNFTDHHFTESKRRYEFVAALSFFRPDRAARAYEGIGDIFSYKQNHEEAAEGYRKSLAKNEEDGVRLKYAGELFELHKYSEAEEQLKAMQVPGGDQPIFFGQVLLMQDKFDEARTWFKDLAADNVDVADLYVALFDLRDQKDGDITDPETSISDTFAKKAQEALDRDAFLAFDYVRLGDELLAFEPAFALDFATKALSVEENYRDAFSLAARAYLARGQYNEAQEQLDKALTISPLDASLWSVQAAIFEAQDNEDQAGVAYARAEELGADSLEFHYNYGVFARSISDFEKATSEFEKVVALDKDMNNNYFDFYFWSAVDSGNLDKASELAKSERADILFDAFVQYKLQKINEVEVLKKTNEVEGFSALDQYLTGLATSNVADAKEFLIRAIDFDEDGLIAPRAKEELEIMENK